MSHQIALVKTFSSDSGGSFSGLSEAMEAINVGTAPGLEQIVALGGDDTSRMDCFETSSSTVSSVCNYTNENDNENENENDSKENDSKENTNDSKENERDTTSNEENASSGANGATTSNTRKKIFAKQSSWKNNSNSNSNSNNSSSTPSREPKKPKPASSKVQHFRLRTRFHNNNHSKNDSDTSSASTTTTTTSVIEAAGAAAAGAAAGEPTKETTTPKELVQETETASNPNITLSSSSSTHSSSRKLFRDEMDIVAYQEWPVQRRLEQKYKYFFHKGNYYRCQQPLQRSPSSVCAGFSVETVATKLGRSPVVVSFDDLDVVHEPSPFSIKGRIQTGLLSKNNSKFNFDEEDSLSTSKTGQSYSMAESFLKAIQSIISCSNSSSPRCGASR